MYISDASEILNLLQHVHARLFFPEYKSGLEDPTITDFVLKRVPDRIKAGYEGSRKLGRK